jgi:hypothetical protein
MKSNFNSKFILPFFFFIFIQKVFAGATGYYITINNDSSYQFTATGKGGGGNKCWDSYDLDNKNVINSHSSIQIYSEYRNLSTCGGGYQRFIIYKAHNIYTKFSLVAGADPISNNTYIKNENTHYQTPSIRYYGLSEDTYCGSIYIDSNGNFDDSQMEMHIC